MKVLIAGEGPTELGRYFHARSYRAIDDVGVLEALLLKAYPNACAVDDGVVWKAIRKFRAGGHRGAETRAVIALAQRALEAGFDAVAFTRDRDRDVDREAEIARGIEDARKLFPHVHVGGSVAVEAIESWILGLLGDGKCESHARPKEQLAGEHGCIGTRAMLEHLGRADLAKAPPSLKRFLAETSFLAPTSPA